MCRVLRKRNRKYIIFAGFLVTATFLFLSLGHREWLSENDVVLSTTELATSPSGQIFKFLPSNNGEDSDLITRERRNHVRNMMKHAWDGYARYAWGENELKPISKEAHSSSVLGSGPLGGTIIDSLDTLIIMNMTQEYEAARAWIENNFDLNVADESLSLFEINIRLLGGLLSAYALTEDRVLLEHAINLGDKMLPAFNTASGVPYGSINLKTGETKGLDPVLAEWGTLSLEFNYLADASGTERFRQPIRRISDAIKNARNKDGIFPMRVMLRPKVTKKKQLKWKDLGHYTLGGGIDSFYEYLLKNWLYSGKTDEESLQLYMNAMKGVQAHLIYRSKPSNFTYLADIVYNKVEHKMGHLACFAGGMFALGGKELGIESHLHLGAEITRTCRESYEKSPVKLGPELFAFNGEKEAEPYGEDNRYYILRPEVVESYFILWRLTRNPIYRDWGWDVVQALENYCRIETGGYSGLVNVYGSDNIHDDVQQSFFLAETLKYLYLLFSDDALIPLDDWVFNTEAHPFPIKGKSPV